MLGYFPLDIICSSKLTVFLERRSRKTFPISERIMSEGKYPSVFSPQMEAVVYIFLNIAWQKANCESLTKIMCLVVFRGNYLNASAACSSK